MKMKALHIYIAIIVSILFLQSCAMNGMTGYVPSNGYEADSSYMGTRRDGPWYSINAKKQNYGSFFNRSTNKKRGGGGYGAAMSGKSAKSYHFSNNTSPKSHKQRDTEWINSQNPNGYTIELAEDEKPASVAKQLFKTPKQERMAQYKHQKNGKTVHTGIYGSFNDSESAEKALAKLPADVREKAKVKKFGNAQKDANTPPSISSGSGTSESSQTFNPPTPPSADD